MKYKPGEPVPEGYRWPGEPNGDNPEVFITTPTQPAQKKPGQLRPEQIKQFFEEVSLHTVINIWGCYGNLDMYR